MKKLLSILLTGAMILMTFSGCAAKESWQTVSSEWLNAEPLDAFGNHSITILGDSITHGANAIDIANDGWAALLKAAINEKTGDNNYGFTSVEGTLWNSAGTQNELHAFPSANTGFKDRGASGDKWTEYRSAELLGTKGLGSYKAGDWLEFTPQETYAYICVYYQQGPNYGSFTVGGSDGGTIADVDGNTTVVCTAEEETFARSAFYDTSLLPEDGKIRITAQTDDEIIITGIGYYNTLDGVVVNNYSNSGLQFAGTGKATNGDMTGLDNSILDFACTSGTVIFSLGYNDGHFFSDYDLFSEKIDYLISLVNERGVKLIVNDLCWDFDTGNGSYEARYPYVTFIKSELKRLAEETNGLYLDQQEINGQAMLDTVTDGAHPSAEGHAMIAATVMEALGLITEEAE